VDAVWIQALPDQEILEVGSFEGFWLRVAGKVAALVYLLAVIEFIRSREPAAGCEVVETPQEVGGS
jgi:hypothetical protein